MEIISICPCIHTIPVHAPTFRPVHASILVPVSVPAPSWSMYTPTPEAVHASAPIHPFSHLHPPIAVSLKVNNSENIYYLLPCAKN